VSASKRDYSFADRAVHRLAFATLPAQVALADVEDRLYADRLEGIAAPAPLFITALPRAGTTLLLELCDALPEYCSHTYRDMPFVLCPLLWQRLSGRFQQADGARERAHGDGMMVSADSAEAFEEIIWKFFFKTHYQPDRIIPWGELQNEDFREFLSQHLRKIVALRGPAEGVPPRYLSKNNANVARLRGLGELYPGSMFLVPFREPLQHAASLLRQHLRFLELHTEDRFARFYMGAIGHHDFGANFRPLDFDGWLAGRQSTEATTLDFWLEYWMACYGHVLAWARAADAATRAPIHLVSYDRLVAAPAAGLETLAGLIEASDPDAFTAQAGRLSPPRAHEVDTAGVDAGLLERAQQLHGALGEAAVV
jgi:hypothetical protein